MTASNTRKLAIRATLHCLTGCSIGEIAGMVVGMALSLHNAVTVILSTILAFLCGYTLALWPITQNGVPLRRAFTLVLAAETFSILAMELTDNAVMVAIPGAMSAGLMNPKFWYAMPISLALAFIVTTPINYFLLKRGRGHALLHEYHDHHE